MGGDGAATEAATGGASGEEARATAHTVRVAGECACIRSAVHAMLTHCCAAQGTRPRLLKTRKMDCGCMFSLCSVLIIYDCNLGRYAFLFSNAPSDTVHILPMLHVYYVVLDC